MREKSGSKKEKNLQTIFDIYIEDCTYAKKHREATVRGEKESFKLFRKLMPEIELIDDIDYGSVIRFFKRLDTRERVLANGVVRTGVSVSTADTYRRRLMKFMDWAKKYKFIEENPFKDLDMEKPDYFKDRTLSKDQVKTILTSIDQYETDLLLRKRDKAMVYVLLTLGLRRGELKGLEVLDLNMEKKKITVRAETSKNKRNRTLTIPDVTLSHLKDYLDERKKRNYKTPNLWVSINKDSGLTMDGIIHWTKKLNKISGVEFHLHQFRHTFAATMFRNGADILEVAIMLGHRTLRMTLVYLASIDDRNIQHKLASFNLEKMLV